MKAPGKFLLSLAVLALVSPATARGEKKRAHRLPLPGLWPHSIRAGS